MRYHATLKSLKTVTATNCFDWSRCRHEKDDSWSVRRSSGGGTGDRVGSAAANHSVVNGSVKIQRESSSADDDDDDDDDEEEDEGRSRVEGAEEEEEDGRVERGAAGAAVEGTGPTRLGSSTSFARALELLKKRSSALNMESLSLRSYWVNGFGRLDDDDDDASGGRRGVGRWALSEDVESAEGVRLGGGRATTDADDDDESEGGFDAGRGAGADVLEGAYLEADSRALDAAASWRGGGEVECFSAREERETGWGRTAFARSSAKLGMSLCKVRCNSGERQSTVG